MIQYGYVKYFSCKTIKSSTYVMLLCFLIKFSHYTPGCLLFHMEKKTTRSFVSCHCRDIFTRGVYCICALTYAADWHKPPQWNIWLIYLHFREFILSSFLFLLLLTAVNPASIQCSLLYIGTKASIQETEQVKKIKKETEKEKKGTKEKTNWTDFLLHSN